MKYIAVLVLAALIASPAAASSATSQACTSELGTLIHVLDTIHGRVEDIKVTEYRDKRGVAAGVKFINDYPPPSTYSADAIVIITSPSHRVGYALVVNDGCVLTNMQFPNPELEVFIHLVMKEGKQGTPA